MQPKISPPSGTAKQEIQALDEAEIITSETQSKMEEVVGFRDLFAHRYGGVDHGIVFAVLNDDLQWFEQFQQELAQWFQQQSNT